MTSSEVLRRYVLGQRRFEGIDIEDDGTKAFAGAHLDKIEIINCFVVASFRGASLKNAVIHANVKTCDFSGADLTGADFRDALLCGTTFKDAHMNGADFTNAGNYGYDLKEGEKPQW
jgi:uncharacterized protein YjbI with pentapeptide repeats